jgi:acyl-CoA thioesterase FadM
MDQAGASEPPCTVTASYSIKLRRPTPFGVTLSVAGEIVEIGEDRANVKMSLSADGKLCATGEGLFVAVREGHPAFHRWN